jgi:hypothetical protein
MPTMIVLVNLKRGVTSEEYERWLEERYVPAVLDLPSVDGWHGYRVVALAEAGGETSCEYVVSVAINDPEQMGRDLQSEQVQRLLEELDEYAEVTQLMTERFV